MEGIMSKRTKEFGHLATTQDQMLYMIIEELREVNVKLSQLSNKEEKEDAPVRRTRNKNSQGTE